MTGTPIYIPPANNYDPRLNLNGPMITDSHGTWMVGYWQAYGGGGPIIVLMTSSTLYGLSSLGGQLGGPCI